MAGKVRIGSVVMFAGIGWAVLTMSAGCTSASKDAGTPAPGLGQQQNKNQIADQIAQVQSDPKIPAGAKAMIVQNLQRRMDTTK